MSPVTFRSSKITKPVFFLILSRNIRILYWYVQSIVLVPVCKHAITPQLSSSNEHSEATCKMVMQRILRKSYQNFYYLLLLLVTTACHGHHLSVFHVSVACLP